jgi:hypothetical protein
MWWILNQKDYVNLRSKNSKNTDDKIVNFREIFEEIYNVEGLINLFQGDIGFKNGAVGLKIG